MDAQSRPPKCDYDWSFNFRSNYGSYDSDSDCDEPPVAQVSTEPSEAKFLEEIDLSRRQDAAVYKPNPFSIAKINATYRQTTQCRPGAPRDLTGKATSGSHKPGSIMHGFKVQASRAPSVSKRDKAPERQPPAARSLQSREPRELSLSGLQNDSLLSDPRISGQKPENFRNSDAVDLYTPSCNVLVEHSASLAVNSAHISTPGPAACLERREQVNHRMEVPSTISTPDNAAAHLMYNPRSTTLSSPAPTHRSAIFTPRISRPDRPLFHSSPLKAPALRNRHASRPFTPSPPGHGFPTGSLARAPIPRLLQIVVSPKVPQQGICMSSSRAAIKREEVSGVLPTSHRTTPALRAREPLKKEESADDFEFSTLAQFPTTASDETQVPPSSSRQPTSIVYNNAWTYRRENNDLNSGISSEGITKSEPVAFPTVTNSFRLPGLLAPLLAAGKESIVNKASGRRVTTYLPPPPPAALSATRPQKSDEPINQDGAKRDIELPMTPPREAARRKMVPLPPIKGEGDVEMANLEATAYPSPGSARRPLSRKKEYDGTGAITASILSVRSKERAYRPPSPPTSDPIVPPYEGDIRVQLDLRTVRDKYGQTKALLQKVSSLFETCLCVFILLTSYNSP
ncbi:hypothetical protein NLJ89_g3544 [Agrocybe chaxingu]|uniref:Uncharacterized protein n=1 Tax=Agrocybe chaxingu TaxID=84603 RepID=A0A9W8K4J1_9AGAR|nr:hypothetical protein NLJ89_g3544 [Agrocybe chaxingu]